MSADRWAEDFALSLRLLQLPDDERLTLIRSLAAAQLRELTNRWSLFAHAGQFAPTGDWRVWLIRAGRGFGKTRAGAEWVCEVARTIPGARIALVGASIEDVAKVMVAGPAGLLNVARPDQEARFWVSDGLVELGNEAVAHVYSAGAPEKLRGPEHHAAWCDELAKWRYGDAAWDNLMLGLRAGHDARCVVTTTPKPNTLMRRVMSLDGLAETRGGTTDNPHLPPSYVATMNDLYAGTRLGRQELDGELIDDADGALWTRAIIEAGRVAEAPAFVRVVIGVDPPAGSERGAAGAAAGDACGIVAVALGVDGLGYVIEDASVQAASPARWADAVAACATRRGAALVVAEKNQGGEMVRDVLKQADAAMPIRLVHAARGKSVRAEPVALLYEQGKVRHVGRFPALEDELCGLVAGGGYAGPGRSPDRADACVWALDELLRSRRGRASVRMLG